MGKTGRKKRRWLYWVGGIILVIIIGLPLATRLMPMNPDPATLQAFFDEHNVAVQSKTHAYKNRSVHYMDVGADTLPLVLFVHGSPGEWSNFKSFMVDSNLVGRVRMVSVDRPGYGQTTGGVEVNLEEQAAAIVPVLETNRSPYPAILVGHSFGGGVVARLAMDYPEKVGGVIFAAPTLAPELEEIMTIQVIGNFPLFRWLIADWLDVCNQEMQPLANELIKTQPHWKNIDMPVTMIHGDADILVPVGNIDYVQEMLPHNPPTVVRFDTMNHFIPWEQSDLILNGILDHLNGLTTEAANEQVQEIVSDSTTL